MLTPSASPAPFHRIKDGPSPTKRPRLTSSSTPSTSSASFISTPPAFSNQTYHTDGTDLHDARRASSFRVLNVWSQLAERYSRPLAEDDIVDLRTGDLIKDRNIIRSTPHQYDIGFFGDLDGTETPTTDEGSDDELDAFAPGADISDELEMERVTREGLVPVREMDPADAEDLREFLEAESRRREEFGSEGEESVEGEDIGGESRDKDTEVELSRETFTDRSTDEVEDELVEDDQWHSDPNLDQTPDPEDSDLKDNITYTVPLKDPDADSGSDDELGIWDDQDEGSTVYAIAGDLDSDDLADGEGVIELPVAETSAPVPRKRGRPRKSTQSPALSTPLPQARSRSKSKSKAKRNMSPPPIVQLHTPPQSSSSVAGTTPDIFALSIPMTSSSTPPRQAKSKSTPRPTPKSKSKQNTPSTTKWKLVPEVVITRTISNSRMRAVSKSQTYPEVLEDDDDFVASPQPGKGRDKSKGKGKERDRALSSPEPSPIPVASEEESESDDPMALVSSPDQQHSRRTPAKELSPSASESEQYQFPIPSPNPSTPARGRPRKRKRALSSSLEADAQSDQAEPGGGPGLPVISPDIDLIDFSRRNYDSYGVGMGRGSPVPVFKSSSHARDKHKSGERTSSRLVNPEPGALIDFLSDVNSRTDFTFI